MTMAFKALVEMQRQLHHALSDANRADASFPQHRKKKLQDIILRIEGTILLCHDLTRNLTGDTNDSSN